jgi:hypothetical protein
VCCAGVRGNGNVTRYASEQPSSDESEMAGRKLEGLRAFYRLGSRDSLLQVATRALPPLRITTRGVPSLPMYPSPIVVWGPIPEPTASAAIIAGRDHFAVVEDDPPSIRIFGANGTAQRVIHLQRTPVAITEDEKQALLARANASTSVPGRGVRDTWPEFRAVWFGVHDDIWAADFNRAMLTTDSRPGWITIFAIDGTPVARLEVRADPIWRDQTRLGEAASSRDVYRVITSDSLDVPRVSVFAIVKPPR